MAVVRYFVAPNKKSSPVSTSEICFSFSPVPIPDPTPEEFLTPTPTPVWECKSHYRKSVLVILICLSILSVEIVWVMKLHSTVY
jgi:hypothetical protein